MKTPDQSPSATDLRNSAKLNLLCEIVGEKLPELLDELGLRLRKTHRYYMGACPIHGGDNATGLTLYREGYNQVGNWYCNTHRCHDIFKPSIIGFVRGVLSHEQFNWSSKGDKIVSFKETIEWLCRFINQPFSSLKVDQSEVEKNRIISHAATFAKLRIPKSQWARPTMQSWANIPSRYFTDRGYSAEILTRYDVGEVRTKDRNNPMFGRVMVPVFDNEYKSVVGVTCRTQQPLCSKCELYHDGECPRSDEQRRNCAKWRNNSGFSKENYLYNYWFARKPIQKTGVAVIVEGPGDVWKAEMSGLDNCVGLFGVNLSDAQQILLESSGAMTVVILLDSDESGQKATGEISETLKRLFKVKTFGLPRKDLGETPVDFIRSEIVPFVKSFERKY